ncbi:MAG: hypothetical protein P8M50_03490 [Paracoccaceae bacterium]|nr:hypothetical protein [Paracoccaceae bacterium]
MRKSKELSVLMSLALHIGGLSIAFHLSSNLYEEKKIYTQNILVSVVSVSEFDAQIYHDPKLKIQKYELPNELNFSDLNHNDFKSHYVMETDSDFVKLDNFEMPKNFSRIPGEIKEKVASLVRNLVKNSENFSDMRPQNIGKLEETKIIEGASFIKDLTLKNESSDVLNLPFNDKLYSRRDTMFIKSDTTLGNVGKVHTAPLVNSI